MQCVLKCTVVIPASAWCFPLPKFLRFSIGSSARKLPVGYWMLCHNSLPKVEVALRLSFQSDRKLYAESTQENLPIKSPSAEYNYTQ